MVINTDLPDLDKATFDAFGELMGSKLPRVLAGHITASETYLQSLRDAPIGDFNALIDAAHPFASSNAQIGLMKISDLAKEIEHLAGRQAVSWEQLMSRIDALCAAYQDAKQALKIYLNDTGREVPSI